MKIHSQVHGSVTVLIAHGPLVGEETLDLRRAVNEVSDTARRVVVDMAEVPYLDSGGIETLLELCDLNLSPHQRPKVANLTETCVEALELTDVLPRLDAFDTVDSALRSFQR